MSYFAGTNPDGITVQDLGNGHADIVVANRGSNDVTVLFGDGTGNFTNGQRLSAGNGPIGVTVQQQNGTVTGLLVTDSDGTLRLLPSVGNGFFNDAKPQITNLGSPVLQALTGGFVLTQTGIFQVNLNTLSATQVFASTTLTSFSTFGNDLVGGFEDGSLALLTETNNTFAETLTFRDAELTDPSALQSVDVAGESEIYATSAGESRVFVFALSDGIPISFTEDRTQTTDVQSVSNAGVALLAALVTGNEEAALEPGNELGFAVGLGEGANIPNALGYLTTLLVGGKGGDSEEDPAGGTDVAPDRPAGLNGLISGIEDAMRLFQKRIAGAEADKDPGIEDDIDPSETLEEINSGNSLADPSKVSIQTANYPFQALDAVMRSGNELLPRGNRYRTLSIRPGGDPRIACATSHNQSRPRPTVVRTAHWHKTDGQARLRPLPANGAALPVAWSGKYPPVPVRDRSDWQVALAAAFILGGLWQDIGRAG